MNGKDPKEQLRNELEAWRELADLVDQVFAGYEPILRLEVWKMLVQRAEIKKTLGDAVNLPRQLIESLGEGLRELGDRT